MKWIIQINKLSYTRW